MPIKKAAFKALKQNKKRQERNKKVKDQLRFLLKKSRKFIEAKNQEKAQEWVAKTIKALDKAAQKKIIKKNNARRKKSRLMKKFNALGKKTPERE